MCLIVFAKDVHPDYRLIVASNRDEFYERPTVPAHRWADDPEVIGGRDEKAGGTWMGVRRDGHFAAVTNVRDLSQPQKEDVPSRGDLVADFLVAPRDPASYLETRAAAAERYNGFNLLAGTPERLFYLTNQPDGGPREVPLGIHGLSNARLDTPWPKVERMKAALAAHLERGTPDPGVLLDLLYDPEPARDESLPDTGIGMQWERVLSAPFIVSENYGTRASTVLLIDRDGQVTFVERSFAARGADPTERRFSFTLEDAPA